MVLSPGGFFYGGVMDDHDRDPKDPSPEQIRAMCEEIRRNWPRHRLEKQHTDNIDVEVQLVKIGELSV